MRRVSVPEIGENLPALVWLIGTRKRDPATIASQGQAAVGQFADFNLRRMLLGSLHIALGQRMDNRRPNRHPDVRRHLPEILTFEKGGHAVGHELANMR